MVSGSLEARKMNRGRMFERLQRNVLGKIMEQ